MQEPTTSTEHSADVIRRLAENLGKVIHAPLETLRLCVLCLVSEGHLIIEDFPGVGKTMLAKAMARSLDCSFSRLQFTPDLLPSDVTGVNVFNQRSNEFEFRPGPIFANLLLVDEINRAPPKTQAALLECMQENQVTIDGVSYALGRPFMVMATQNPIEYEGTYPLPEAQLDRFTMRLDIGYPPPDQEARMLSEQTSDPPLDELEPVTNATGITDVIDEATRIFVEPSLNRYVVDLVGQTRSDQRLYLGASPRAGISLLRVSKARALADGRDYVLPDDVQAVATAVLAHRLILGPEARANGTPPQQLVREAVERTPVPADVSRADRTRSARAAARRRHLSRRLGLRLEVAVPDRHGLALAVVGARIWVEIMRQPVSLRRHLGAREYIEGDDVDDRPRGERATQSGPAHARGLRADQQARRAPRGAEPARAGAPRALRPPARAARPLPVRRGPGRVRGSVRARARGAEPRRRVDAPRLSAPRRARARLLGARRDAGRRSRRAAAHGRVRPAQRPRVPAGRVAAQGALANDREARRADGEGARGHAARRGRGAARRATAASVVGESFDVQVRAAGSILRANALRGRRALLSITSSPPETLPGRRRSTASGGPRSSCSRPPSRPGRTRSRASSSGMPRRPCRRSSSSS